MISVDFDMDIRDGAGAEPAINSRRPDADAISHMLAAGITPQARRALLGLMLTAAARADVTRGPA